jgi:hypothetical protein
MERYEAYRRAGISKSTLKRFLHNITGSQINNNTTIVVAGAAKVFVGEITELALVYLRILSIIGCHAQKRGYWAYLSSSYTRSSSDL